MNVETAMRSVADITRVQAIQRPNQVAMVFEGRNTTFVELDRRASQVANGLRGEKLKTQARIALLDTNSDIFFEVLFGAAKANEVLVPVSSRLTAPEIASIINDAVAGSPVCRCRVHRHHREDWG
jgi:acyl-CoA synthetase (AMP-forming)/AMP-acid ligase II